VLPKPRTALRSFSPLEASRPEQTLSRKEKLLGPLLESTMKNKSRYFLLMIVFCIAVSISIGASTEDNAVNFYLQVRTKGASLLKIDPSTVKALRKVGSLKELSTLSPEHRGVLNDKVIPELAKLIQLGASCSSCDFGPANIVEETQFLTPPDLDLPFNDLGTIMVVVNAYCWNLVENNKKMEALGLWLALYQMAENLETSWTPIACQLSIHLRDRAAHSLLVFLLANKENAEIWEMLKEKFADLKQPVIDRGTMIKRGADGLISQLHRQMKALKAISPKEREAFRKMRCDALVANGEKGGYYVDRLAIQKEIKRSIDFFLSDGAEVSLERLQHLLMQAARIVSRDLDVSIRLKNIQREEGPFNNFHRDFLQSFLKREDYGTDRWSLEYKVQFFARGKAAFDKDQKKTDQFMESYEKRMRAEDTIFEKALRLLTTDPKKALPQIEALADKRDSQALQFLGTAYIRGTYVKEDKERGIKLLKSASMNGCSLAQVCLARHYYFTDKANRNMDEALKWYLLADENGQYCAGEVLGILISKKPTPDLDREIVKWAGKEAAIGGTNGLFILGCHLATGRGGKRDRIEAMSCFIRCRGYYGLRSDNSTETSRINQQGSSILGELEASMSEEEFQEALKRSRLFQLRFPDTPPCKGHTHEKELHILGI
jgi:hypothetical protein